MAYTLRAQPGIGLDIARRTAPAPIFEFVGEKTVPNAGDPWWMDALNALSAPGGLVTNTANEIAKDGFQFKDLWHGPVDPIVKGVKSQWDNWWHGGDGAGFEDIPILGTLAHINNQSKKGSDILGNLGVKGQGWKTWGGLGVDIALDPLTYLTFGGTAAVKAGAKSMAGTARGIGKELGLGKVTYKNVAQKASDRAYQSVLANTGDALKANKAQADVFNMVKTQVDNAGKAARNKAQNALVNIDVPFINRTTFTFGRKPKALQKSSPKIAAHGASALRRQLDRAGLVGNTGDAFVQKALGKTDLKDVTLQEYNWLKDQIKRYSDHAAKNPVQSPFDNIMRGGAENIVDPRVVGGGGAIPPGAARALTSGDNIASTGFGGSRMQPGANVLDADFRPVDPMDSFRFDEFVPDMGGVSPFGARIMDSVRGLNPRAMGTRTSGGIVNAQGDAIQDAYGAIRGSGREFDRLSKEGRKIMGKLTPVQQRVVEYMLEGQDFTKIPGFKAEDGFAAAPAASWLRDQYRMMAEAEGGVGALDNIRQSYAPHIVNRTPEQLQEILERYADDPHLQRLAQISGSNRFNQQRRSFDTLAQLDNYLADLGDQIAKTSDPAQLARLQQKYDDVSTLFERDPFKAYQKRLHKSFRTRELAGLYRRMEEDGIIIPPGEARGFSDRMFVQLDQKEASRLGVPAGSLMHKEVKESLMKINDLFTEQGLNKFLDHATAVTNIWKGIVTAARPVHHFNNLIGNLLNNSLAGVSVKSYAKATNTLNRMLRGKPKQEDLDLMAEAMKKGVFGQNHSDEYRRVFGDMPANKIRKLEQAVTGNKYMNFMRKWIGDSVDNWSRLAHYISVKDKTGSAELASQSVRKHLFNYGEQTKADRAIRLVIPFWNWTKRNIPLQLENLLKQPRHAATYAKLQDASFESQGEDRTAQPDFIREGYFLNPLTGQLRNPRAPVADLTNLSDPLQFLASSSNPMLKSTFELAANRNVFTGQPIDRNKERTGQYSSEALLNYGMNQTGLLNDFYKLFNGTTNPLDMLLGRELELRRE